MTRWFGSLGRAGCPADVVTAIPAPGNFEVFVVVGLRLVDAAMIAAMRAFVAAGGTLIGRVALATLNREHVAPAEPVPWGLTDIFGCERIEFSPLSPSLQPPKERLGEHVADWATLGRQGAVPVVAQAPLSGTFGLDTWCDHMQAQGCAVWSRFAAGSSAAGLPAVTCHTHGSGRAVYIAGLIDEALVDAVVGALVGTLIKAHQATTQSADFPHSSSPWVEVIPVDDKARRLWFVLNHGHVAVRLEAKQALIDLMDPIADPLALEPYQVRLLSRS